MKLKFGRDDSLSGKFDTVLRRALSSLLVSSRATERRESDARDQHSVLPDEGQPSLLDTEGSCIQRWVPTLSNPGNNLSFNLKKFGFQSWKQFFFFFELVSLKLI